MYLSDYILFIYNYYYIGTLYFNIYLIIIILINNVNNNKNEIIKEKGLNTSYYVWNI